VGDLVGAGGMTLRRLSVKVYTGEDRKDQDRQG
jgi:hypothetical protein